MGDGLDSNDAGAIRAEGYLENIYRVHRPDADAERQQSGEHFQDVLQDQEEGEQKEHPDEKNEKTPHDPLPSRATEPLHDDVHLSAPAQRILAETVCDKKPEDLIAEDEENTEQEPGFPTSGGHIDVIA